ncbi:MAG: DNA-directed RNA polymerase subunit omega [Epulopiscium sp.]|jgi:DNA-directed RNA polymerase subunit omega|nr:DNA-directed RNA polymerase subunit omega [Candidatus Epulonipiscium sp.]
MLHPSYSDLLEVLNNDPNNDNTIGSRYTIVIAAAKRARQLVDHAKPLTDKVKIDKPVSIAVHELHEGKIRIKRHVDTSSDASYDACSDSTEETSTPDTAPEVFHKTMMDYEKEDFAKTLSE